MSGSEGWFLRYRGYVLLVGVLETFVASALRRVNKRSGGGTMFVIAVGEKDVPYLGQEYFRRGDR